VPDTAWKRATLLFHGFALDDAGTEAEIRRIDAECGYLADPHTAIGIAAARAHAAKHPGIPMVAMATADPAKFPQAMQCATGRTPPLPPALADLYQRDEHYAHAPNQLAAVQALVRASKHRNLA
jgi:threonine synthase